MRERPGAAGRRDLSEERPILEPVHGQGEPLTVDDVADLAKDSCRKLTEQPPLGIVEVHGGARHLFWTFREPDFVAQFARDRAIVIGHFPKPKTRSLHIRSMIWRVLTTPSGM